MISKQNELSTVIYIFSTYCKHIKTNCQQYEYLFCKCLQFKKPSEQKVLPYSNVFVCLAKCLYVFLNFCKQSYSCKNEKRIHRLIFSLPKSNHVMYSSD